MTRGTKLTGVLFVLGLFLTLVSTPAIGAEIFNAPSDVTISDTVKIEADMDGYWLWAEDFLGEGHLTDPETSKDRFFHDANLSLPLKPGHVASVVYWQAPGKLGDSNVITPQNVITPLAQLDFHIVWTSMDDKYLRDWATIKVHQDTWGEIVTCPEDANVNQIVEVAAYPMGTWAVSAGTLFKDNLGTDPLGPADSANVVYWRLPNTTGNVFIDWASTSGNGETDTKTLTVHETGWGEINSYPYYARMGDLIRVAATRPGTWYTEGPGESALYKDAEGTTLLGNEEADVVYWRLPTSINSNPARYAIVWDSPITTDSSAKEIFLYTHVQIKDKSSLESIYYPGLTEEVTALGGYELDPYFWQITRPDFSIEVFTPTETFKFEAPTEGVFAGINKVRAADKLRRVIDTSVSEEYTKQQLERDTVDMYQFAWLDGEVFFIMENSPPVTYTLSGAPTEPLDPETGECIPVDDNPDECSQLTYRIRLMSENNENSFDLTNQPEEYGYVTLDNGDTPISGQLVFTYHPPANPSGQNSFWFRGIASEELKYQVQSYEANIYDVWLGPITIRVTDNIKGTFVDEDGATLSGVEITLLAPAKYLDVAPKWDNDQVPVNFSYTLPAEHRYYFMASKDGYATKYFTSVDWDTTGGEIVLEKAGAQSYIQGEVDHLANLYDLADGEFVTISLLDYSQAPSVILAETKLKYSNPVTGTVTNNYRLDIAGDTPEDGSKYCLIAYAKDYNCTYLLNVGPDPATGYQFPITIDLNMVETKWIDTTGNYAGDLVSHYLPEARVKGDLPNHKEDDGARPATELTHTVMGGLAFDISHAITDTYRATVDLRPGFIDTSLLSDTVKATFSFQSEDNIYYEGDAYSEYANGSKYILDATVNTNPDINGVFNSNIVGEHGAIITMSFDLLRVNLQDFEEKVYSVRHGGTATELETNLGTDLPLSDILAIDYTGDGQTGWVTFKARGFSKYGVGGSEETTYQGAGSYKWPEFDRYELWGCFVNTAMHPTRHSSTLWLTFFGIMAIAGIVAIRRRRKV